MSLRISGDGIEELDASVAHFAIFDQAKVEPPSALKSILVVFMRVSAVSERPPLPERCIWTRLSGSKRCKRSASERPIFEEFGTRRTHETSDHPPLDTLRFEGPHRCNRAWNEASSQCTR